MDLKQRGLLDETLVIWRWAAYAIELLPMIIYQKKIMDADHHPRCYSIWWPVVAWSLASHGETDEFGYNIVRDPVHINDFYATVSFDGT